MKSLRKILSVIICFAILCSVPVFSFGAESGAESVSASGRGLFSALGIETYVPDVSVTRGQFVTSLIKLMDFGTFGSGKQTFADVSVQDTELHSAVEFAVGLGAVSAGDNFYPERLITYAEACKMTVEALGYGNDAKWRGGYPAGYMAVASSLDLDDGIDTSAQFTSDAMYVLLGNAANTRVKTITSCKADGEFFIYTAQADVPLLEAYRDIICVEGVITASDAGYLYDSSSEFDSGKIMIDDREYGVEKGVICPLGYYTNAYAQKRGNRYIVIYSDITANSVTQIGAGELGDYSENAVTYYDENGKEKTLRLTSDLVVLYNGKACENYTKEDILISDGYLEAVDNNDDGRTDILCVWDAIYLEVDYVNIYSDEYDYVFFDKNKKNNIFISSETNYRSDVDILKITRGNILEAFVSKDKSFVRLSLLSNTASGVVDGIGANGEIHLGGKKYSSTKYFDEFYKNSVTPGKALTLCYDGFGKAVAITVAGGGSMKLAYFDNMSDKVNGLDDTVRLKLFTEDGEVITPKLADKVSVNSTTKNAREWVSILSSAKGQLIKFALNDEGEVSKINTESEEDGIYDASADGADTLKRFRFSGDDSDVKIYYKIFGYIVPHFTLNNSTKIFKISLSDTSDEERFSLGNLSFLKNDALIPSNSIRPYNVSVSGMAGAVLYKSSEAAATSLSNDSASAMVAECSSALDDNGDEVFKIKLYAGDKFSDYFIKKDAKFLTALKFNEDGYPFNVGDLIRYAVDDKGIYLLTALKDFDGATETLLLNAGDNTELHYYFGQIYAEGSGSVAIKKADGSIVYIPISIGDEGVLEDGKILTQPKEKITTYLQMGEDCHKILIRCRYSQPTQIYVIK